jgi:hypothetical protein
VCRSRSLASSELATHVDRFRKSASRSNSVANSRSPSVDRPNSTPLVETLSPKADSSAADHDADINTNDGIDDGANGEADDQIKEVEQSATSDIDDDGHEDQFADWDNGKILTAEERATVLSLGSNYERSRAMNIRRRQ